MVCKTAVMGYISAFFFSFRRSGGLVREGYEMLCFWMGWNGNEVLVRYGMEDR